jgi:predicted outer membrane repeat protein
LLRVRAIRVGVTVLLALALSAPAAAAWEPPAGAVFNDPMGTIEARWRIVHSVDEAIRGAQPGSRVLITSYYFDSESSANALIAAHERGVQVQVVVDGIHATTRQPLRIAAKVNADNIDPATGQPPLDAEGNPLRWGPDNSFVVFCQNSCRNVGGAMHSKFYVFTETGTAKDVVMVSSSNLNKGGAVKGWNDLYVIKGRPDIVADYAAVHAEMAEDTARDGDQYREFVRGEYTSRFFPRPGGGDPTYEDLANIRCRGATEGSGRNGRTAINISMFTWFQERGIRLARRVAELGRLGCAVSVIYGAPGVEVRSILKTAARRGHISLWNSRRLDRGLVRTHEKYYLVNGVYGDDTSSWRVHAGSQNWVNLSDHADENTLNIESRVAYAQYLRNWSQVRKWSMRVG